MRKNSCRIESTNSRPLSVCTAATLKPPLLAKEILCFSYPFNEFVGGIRFLVEMYDCVVSRICIPDGKKVLFTNKISVLEVPTEVDLK